jgi:hypothetical protein
MSHGKGITRIGTWGDPPRIITTAEADRSSFWPLRR